MKVFAHTDVGRVRPINEDAYYLPREGEHFCAIADGMGGHNAGEVASAMAVEVFSREMRFSTISGGPAMRRAVERANTSIFDRARTAEQYSGMGTTFTALGQWGRDAYIAHVGDSRAYLLRNGTIMRLTLDHTLVEEMVLKGLISIREAKYHPKRNYITRALGTAERVEVDMIQVEIRPGDVFLLCTDGLSNHVEEKRMLEITRGPGDWQQKLRDLVDAALEDGGTDNITALYAIFEEEQQ